MNPDQEPTVGGQQPKLHPDTPIDTVTLERVAEIFNAEGLKYRIEEPDLGDGEATRLLRTGFSNAAIALQVRNDTLVCDSVWRGNIPATEGPQLLAAINEWNSKNFAPTLRFFESGVSELAVSAVRELNVTEGASRNQIGAFIMSTLDSILQSFAWVEGKYPNLVTWEDTHHD